MKIKVGTDYGYYTFNAVAKTITIGGVGADIITQDDVLAVIHAITGETLYQLNVAGLVAASWVPANGGGTLTLNASVSTAGMTNSDPLFISVDAATPEICANVTTKFRDAFESFTDGVKWNLVLGSGDIVRVDGNAIAASYLVISKDPLTTGTVTSITTIDQFALPLDVATGLHRSQATVGQEFSFELIDSGTALPAPPDLTISTISQATTTLTVNTTTGHGLVPGKRIQISEVPDSRLNYPALVVATIPTPTQFTVTAGPGGNIPSLTVGPIAGGTVSFRSALGYAPNGVSEIFENASATQASIYVRSEAGDVLPSGTPAGSHVVTVGSTASIQGINAANTFAFQPTTEYRITAMIDRVQISDVGVDGTGQASGRANRTQVTPSTMVNYNVRFRATNSKALTAPAAKVISVSKAGSTTWNFTTDGPHGLASTDQGAYYGNRDQTNFPNITAAGAITVTGANTFTMVSTTGTATGYGGTIYKVNGGNLPSALGAISQVIQSITRVSNVLTVVGNASWSGLVVGDYINIHGGRVDGTGVDLGVDGAYKVSSIATTTLTLIEIPGESPTGADIGLTNCGGAVIKRTDLRISFVRILDFERLRVEPTPRPSADAASAFPVTVNNSPSVSLTGTSNAVQGNAAHDAAVSGNPNRIAGRAVTSNYTAVASGDTADMITTTVGVQVIKPYAIPELGWAANLSLTTTTAVAIQSAAGAGLKRHITAGQWINTGASSVDLIILDGATERWRLPLPPNVPVYPTFPTELPTTAATALNANLSAVGTVRANFQGYTAP